MPITLGEIAARFELELRGDPALPIEGVCGLSPGKPGCLSFLSNPKLRAGLAGTQAAAVIVSPKMADALQGPGLVVRDPYLAYARVARLFDPRREVTAGVHPSAVIDAEARVAVSAQIGAGVVIEAGASIGEGCQIAAGCVIERHAVIGAGTRLKARVAVGSWVQIGERCQIEPGAVIGSRGFGNAMGPNGWEEVPQLGTVIIGNDVEIGANTTIDRGAIDDTVIEDNVRLDNLIQVAHNCRIGAHTAIAALTGIAGSTRIGKRCLIGGAVGMNGHIEIGDDVVILGRAMVTHSLLEKGVYGSGMPVAPAREWRKTVARIHRLDRYEARIKNIESSLNLQVAEADEHDTDAAD